MTTTSPDSPSITSRFIETATDALFSSLTGESIDRSRNSWCTPEWLLTALYGGWRYGGRTAVDIDPCSNPRSKVPARTHLLLEAGDNGLPPTSMPQGSYIHGGRTVLTNRDTTTFINPPYSRGQVLRWVTHWCLTNYTFLLRWDPSTEWWKVLMRSSECVWVPNQRINFTPPPGVTSSSNPFPHALYFKRMPDTSAQRRLSYLGRFLKEVDTH